jgi:hypothetical protein
VHNTLCNDVISNMLPQLATAMKRHHENIRPVVTGDRLALHEAAACQATIALSPSGKCRAPDSCVFRGVERGSREA